MTQLHELIGGLVPEDAEDAEVVIGIEPTAARGSPRWSQPGIWCSR